MTRKACRRLQHHPHLSSGCRIALGASRFACHTKASPTAVRLNGQYIDACGRPTWTRSQRSFYNDKRPDIVRVGVGSKLAFVLVVAGPYKVEADPSPRAVHLVVVVGT